MNFFKQLEKMPHWQMRLISFMPILSKRFNMVFTHCTATIETSLLTGAENIGSPYYFDDKILTETIEKPGLFRRQKLFSFFWSNKTSMASEFSLSDGIRNKSCFYLLFETFLNFLRKILAVSFWKEEFWNNRLHYLDYRVFSVPQYDEHHLVWGIYWVMRA